MINEANNCWLLELGLTIFGPPFFLFKFFSRVICDVTVGRVDSIHLISGVHCHSMMS